ncbi:MAG: hypothetical protein KKH74_06470 [Gammaproteobacteria bacterium]|nr:hypothetical protein [Gammaproteobacteria bacterium]MBU1732287.1 hypothetical protein [Gammaproteobacteria bacterium]MBU1893857.1 hypothetical protein [Gammaproteobacteria bacterium]
MLANCVLQAEKVSAAVSSSCTWNPADKVGFTLSNGNLTLQGVYAANIRATAGVQTGAYYYEFRVDAIGTYSTHYPAFGIKPVSWAIVTYPAGEGIRIFGYDNAPSVGAVYACAFDMGAKTVKFYKNNTLIETKSIASVTEAWKPFFGFTNSYDDMTITARFSQSEWTYAPPAGYIALP